MVKHTQAIRWQFADEFFECVCSFCGVGTERVKKWKPKNFQPLYFLDVVYFIQLFSLFYSITYKNISNFIKKRLQWKCFPVNFAQILGTLSDY